MPVRKGRREKKVRVEEKRVVEKKEEPRIGYK
jgi:hypothetical protein